MLDQLPKRSRILFLQLCSKGGMSLVLKEFQSWLAPVLAPLPPITATTAVLL